MKPLDVQHELPVHPEPAELPEPHTSPTFNWLFSLAIGVSAMFVFTLILLIATGNLFLVLIVAPILLIFTTVLVHTIAGRAR